MKLFDDRKLEIIGELGDGLYVISNKDIVDYMDYQGAKLVHLTIRYSDLAIRAVSFNVGLNSYGLTTPEELIRVLIDNNDANERIRSRESIIKLCKRKKFLGLF